MGVRFQYARELRRDGCNECNGNIHVGALVSYYQKEWYHFDCFLKQRAVDEFRKSDIMILLKRRFINNGPRSVSLEEYDKHPDGFELDISLTELTKIREQFALAKEHKTDSFIPWASKTANLICYECFCAPSTSVVGGEQLGLYFQGKNYHLECLLKTGKVNVDAKEICDYDSLSEDDQKLLDELFNKDDDSFFLPCCVPFDNEYCSFLNCRGEKYDNNGPRIRYHTKTYHLECFAEMGKVNMDGEEIENYHKLSGSQKLRLRNLFKKSNDFDIPLIEKTIRNDYCTLPDCLAANGQPSKFPWPYTIKPRELQIKFHGDIYHPKCFKASRKVYMDQLLEENFEDIEMDIEESESSGDDDGSDSSDFESDQMDDDNVNEGPPAKKPKMEHQMQDENVSNENIHNEFDNDQEPFDATNVKEEMSEPIILQMNTLNELNNTQVGPQIVNDREEREGNQESVDHAAEE
uniref:Uncharacterized protein n=1 Tax=Panagrolaimus davidi TaxID=227884 RepID=A0A914QED6_9BILA